MVQIILLADGRKWMNLREVPRVGTFIKDGQGETYCVTHVVYETSGQVEIHAHSLAMNSVPRFAATAGPQQKTANPAIADFVDRIQQGREELPDYEAATPPAAGISIRPCAIA